MGKSYRPGARVRPNWPYSEGPPATMNAFGFVGVGALSLVGEFDEREAGADARLDRCPMRESAFCGAGGGMSIGSAGVLEVDCVGRVGGTTGCWRCATACCLVTILVGGPGVMLGLSWGIEGFVTLCWLVNTAGYFFLNKVQ
jgi:hypothetical protein